MAERLINFWGERIVAGEKEYMPYLSALCKKLRFCNRCSDMSLIEIAHGKSIPENYPKAARLCKLFKKDILAGAPIEDIIEGFPEALDVFHEMIKMPDQPLYRRLERLSPPRESLKDLFRILEEGKATEEEIVGIVQKLPGGLEEGEVFIRFLSEKSSDIIAASFLRLFHTAKEKKMWCEAVQRDHINLAAAVCHAPCLGSLLRYCSEETPERIEEFFVKVWNAALRSSYFFQEDKVRIVAYLKKMRPGVLRTWGQNSCRNLLSVSLFDEMDNAQTKASCIRLFFGEMKHFAPTPLENFPNIEGAFREFTPRAILKLLVAVNKGNSARPATFNQRVKTILNDLADLEPTNREFLVREVLMRQRLSSEKLLRAQALLIKPRVTKALSSFQKYRVYIGPPTVEDTEDVTRIFDYLRADIYECSGSDLNLEDMFESVWLKRRAAYYTSYIVSLDDFFFEVRAYQYPISFWKTIMLREALEAHCDNTCSRNIWFILRRLMPNQSRAFFDAALAAKEVTFKENVAILCSKEFTLV